MVFSLHPTPHTPHPVSTLTCLSPREEKKSGEIIKQTPRRPDAQTRRNQIPRKISFTREKEKEKLVIDLKKSP
ncbi:MAG: hypothetical protein F6K58_28445 [Symploca sp. SIO2E9]|nr:hypothetical protein [Symploca sp. SIO2E9]